jgi:hypothetical protein
MNERIRQLADEAGLRFTQLMSNPMVPIVDGKETDLEKFAELIVAECCQVLSKETIRHDGYGYNQHALYQKIREHFGVE